MYMYILLYYVAALLTAMLTATVDSSILTATDSPDELLGCHGVNQAYSHDKLIAFFSITLETSSSDFSFKVSTCIHTCTLIW